MSVRDRKSWEYYREVADGETLTFFNPSSEANSLDKGLFYIKFNILKLLSRPIILSKLQEFVDKHPESMLIPIVK